MAISASQQFKHFNSIKVRLELGWCGVEKLLVDDFNSIKVRLELAVALASKSVVDEFQFHKGTIRTHCLGIYNILIFNRIRGCKVNKYY